jgi:FixJ family two-component response regulator
MYGCISQPSGLPADICRRLLRIRRKNGGAQAVRADRHQRLSNREFEVLRLLGSGTKVNAIAADIAVQCEDRSHLCLITAVGGARRRFSRSIGGRSFGAARVRLEEQGSGS